MAYGRGDTKITNIHVQRAILDTEDVRIEQNFTSKDAPKGPGWGLVLAATVVGCLLTYLAVSFLNI